MIGQRDRTRLCESIQALSNQSISPIETECHTFIEHLLPVFIRGIFLIQYLQNELGPVVPGGEIGKIRSNHFLGVLKFGS